MLHSGILSCFIIYNVKGIVAFMTSLVLTSEYFLHRFCNLYFYRKPTIALIKVRKGIHGYRIKEDQKKVKRVLQSIIHAILLMDRLKIMSTIP